MKTKKLLLIPLLLVSVLVGCTPSDEIDVMTPLQVLEKASEFGSLLVNNGTGVAYSDRSLDVNLNYGEKIYATKSFVVKNVLLTEDGEKTNVNVAITYATDADSLELWDFVELEGEVHYLLEPAYPEFGSPDFKSLIIATFKFAYDEGEEVIYDVEYSVSWSIVHHAPRTEPKNVKIADLQNGVVEAVPGDNLTVRGYITNHYFQGTGPSDQKIYNGVMIADGDRAIQLYAGQISNTWFLGKKPAFKIGDLVEAEGKLDVFYGLKQIKPDTLKIVGDPKIERPVDLVIDNPATQWNNTNLLPHTSRMMKLNNLIFKKATLNAVTAHGYIYFTPEGTNIEILMYVNLNIGVVEKQKLHDAVATWTAGTTKLNYHGILGWHDEPQLSILNADEITLAS